MSIHCIVVEVIHSLQVIHSFTMAAISTKKFSSPQVFSSSFHPSPSLFKSSSSLNIPTRFYITIHQTHLTMAPMTRAMATKGTKRPREQSAERTASATFIADPDANNSDNDASKGGNDQSISPPELIAPDGDLILVLGNGHKLRVHSLFLTRHVAFLKKLVSGTSGASSPLGDDGVPEIGIPNIHPVAVSLFCRAIHSKPAVRPPTAEDMHHLGRFVRKHECHEPMLYAADCWFSRIGFSTVLGGKVLSQLLVAAFWLKRPVWLRRYGLPFIDSDIDFDENALEGFKANIDSKLLRGKYSVSMLSRPLLTSQ